MLYDATQHGEEDQQLTTGREEAHRDADEEKAQLEGLEQGLAQGLASLSREVQELRTELRVLKSAEPLVSGKPWLPFKHKAVAGPPAAKRSPTNQVAV